VGGRSTNNEALRAAQRERILSAAERLLVTHGVERARLRDVGEAAGVSIGTVQHYFDTRDRLIAELFDWSSERRLEAWLAAAPAGGDPWTRLEALLAASLPEPLMWRSRVWIEFCAMARDDDLRAKLDRFYDAWRPPFRQVIEDGIAAGVFHPVAPVDDIVDLFVILGDGASVAISLGAPGISAEQLRRVFLETARAMLGVDRSLADPVAGSEPEPGSITPHHDRSAAAEPAPAARPVAGDGPVAGHGAVAGHGRPAPVPSLVTEPRARPA
jgi:AcrR family transcriptional regulator